MKKFLVLLAALAFVMCLCGCEGYVSLLPGSEPVAVENAPAPDGQETDAGDFREQSLLEFMGWRDFAASYYDDTPVALSMRVGDNFDSPIFDRTSIISACDALRAMTVTGRAPGVDTAAQKTVFTFTMADGETYSVTFTGRDVTLTAGTYTVTGGDRSTTQRALRVTASSMTLLSLVSLWVTRVGSSPESRMRWSAPASSFLARTKSTSGPTSFALPFTSAARASLKMRYRSGVLWKLGMVSWRVSAGKSASCC